MSRKSKTPSDAGASCDCIARLSLPLSTPLAIQVQFLIAAHHVRPELAAMVAALAFGGGAYHG